MKEQQMAVIKYLKDREGEYVSPTQIAQDLFDKPYNAASSFGSKICKGLLRMRLVERNSKGQYRVLRDDAQEMRGPGEFIPAVENLLARRRQAIIAQFTVVAPPLAWCWSWDITPEEDEGELEDFVCDNLKEEFAYSTSGGVIDMAWEMARSQLDNGGKSGTDDEAQKLAKDAGYEDPYTGTFLRSFHSAEGIWMKGRDYEWTKIKPYVEAGMFECDTEIGEKVPEHYLIRFTPKGIKYRNG